MQLQIYKKNNKTNINNLPQKIWYDSHFKIMRKFNCHKIITQYKQVQFAIYNNINIQKQQAIKLKLPLIKKYILVARPFIFQKKQKSELLNLIKNYNSTNNPQINILKQTQEYIRVDIYIDYNTKEKRYQDQIQELEYNKFKSYFNKLGYIVK